MLESRGGFRLVVLGMIALVIVVSLGQVGAKTAPADAGLKVANFDLVRLKSESKFTIETEKSMKQMTDDAELRLTTWRVNAFLPVVDQKRLADLKVEEKNNPTTFDMNKKNEAKKLEDQQAAIFTEAQKLSANQNTLTPQEKERLTTLGRSQSDTEARIRDEQAKLQKDFDTMNNNAVTKLVKDMRDAVAKVAKDKGYALVLSNEVAFYADADITDAAIAVMNKK